MDTVVTEPSTPFPANKRTYLPSNDDKIHEAVNIGSVFLALDVNFFNAESLLQWLTTVPQTIYTQVAYKAACTKIHPNKQYMSDGYHFIVKKPEYTSLAIGAGLMPEIPDSNDGNSNNPVVAHICDMLIKINSDASVRRLAALILAGNGSAAYIQANLLTCFRARNFPHLRNVSAHELNIGLVAADWPTKFRYNEKLPSLIIQRVAQLQREAPVYYAGVAYQAYHKVAMKLNKDKLFTNLSRDELTTLNTFFPNIIDERVLGYSDLAYKIALLGNDVAGYILGFPIQNMIPSEDQIHHAVQMLSEQGIQRYADGIKEYVASTYLPALPPTRSNTNDKVKYANDTDVITEDIDNYVPFDIVAYQAGEHVHRFTRAEFDQLAESKKNPWTNDWIPITVLSTIKARAEAAKELGLPPARSLCEMLERVETGTLFVEDEGPKPVTAATGPSPFRGAAQVIPGGMAASPADIINMLMGAAMMGQWNPGLPVNPLDDMPALVPNAGTETHQPSPASRQPTNLPTPDFTPNEIAALNALDQLTEDYDDASDDDDNTAMNMID